MSIEDCESSYSYTFSTSRKKYNKDDGIEVKRYIKVNDNGNEDTYYRKSVIKNGTEEIIKEEGNKKLDKNDLQKDFIKGRKKLFEDFIEHSKGFFESCSLLPWFYSDLLMGPAEDKLDENKNKEDSVNDKKQIDK